MVLCRAYIKEFLLCSGLSEPPKEIRGTRSPDDGSGSSLTTDPA